MRFFRFDREYALCKGALTKILRVWESQFFHFPNDESLAQPSLTILLKYFVTLAFHAVKSAIIRPKGLFLHTTARDLAQPSLHFGQFSIDITSILVQYYGYR